MSMNGMLQAVPPDACAALADGHAHTTALAAVMAGEPVRLDALWDALGFIFAVAAGENPLEWNGLPLDWHDTGYGPPLLLDPGEVRLIADAVAPVDDQQVRAAFDPVAMQIERRHVVPDREQLEIVVERARAYRQFFAEAATRGDGALFYLT